MRDWVLEARDILRKNNRLAVADLTIGEVLSGSSGGDDGAWPNEAVRNLIEELTSDDFEHGIILGLMNSEGVRWVDPKDPGKHERETAEKYGKWAERVTASWGRTGAMLRRLKDQYQSSAKREDEHFQLREDLLD